MRIGEYIPLPKYKSRIVSDYDYDGRVYADGVCDICKQYKEIRVSFFPGMYRRCYACRDCREFFMEE